MRIMTFNVQHFLDFKKRVIDIGLFADKIKAEGADFCGLNEIRGEGPFEGYTNQTDAIGDALGFNRYFGKAVMIYGENPYGNAFVTRYPIVSAETFIVPDPEDRTNGRWFETRCAIKLVAETELGRVCFVVCHMGLNDSERINAVKVVCDIIDSTDLPMVVMGDWNDTPDSPILAPIFERLSDTAELGGAADGATFPSDAPNKKIDYILYRGLKCVSCRIITDIVSDHFPIVADFDAE